MWKWLEKLCKYKGLTRFHFCEKMGGNGGFPLKKWQSGNVIC